MPQGQNLDKILGNLDCFINRKGINDTVPLGLTIHYSTGEKRWAAYYGKKQEAHKVWGSSIEQVLNNLVDKMNTPI